MTNETKRIPITLNDDQWSILWKAATDPLALHTSIQMDMKKGITTYNTPSRQALVNAAWEKIAPDFGIIPTSAKLDPERGERAFTAIPIE